MRKTGKWIVCTLLLFSLLSTFISPVFAAGTAPVTLEISSLTADVSQSSYTYRAATNTLTLSGGDYVLIGKPNVEFKLKIYVSGNAKIKMQDLIAVQENGSDFHRGEPVMEISPQRSVSITFSGDCRLRGGALSCGILMMNKSSLELFGADENAKFSAGVYRFGGAGIAVSNEDESATVKINTTNLKKGYIALGGGSEGLDNVEGRAVDLGKGKLYVNDKAVTKIQRATRWSGTKATDVFALIAEGAMSSDWFAAYGDVVTVFVTLKSGQSFEKWFDSPETPVYFTDAKAKLTTVTMPNYDVCVYPVLKSTGGATLKVYNIDIRGGESDALACNEGETVEINASTFVGKKFIGWKYEGPVEVKFDDPNSVTTKFVMPKGNVIIVAQFEDEGIPIEIVGGKASRERAIAGTVITVTAQAPDNKVFYEWKIVTGTDSKGKKLKLDNKRHAVTTFTMIDKEVKLEAVFVDSPRTVTVSGGIADRTMADKGDKITLMAKVPSDQIFKEWQVSYVSPSGSITKSEKTYTESFTTIRKEKQAITRIKAVFDKKPTFALSVNGGQTANNEAAAGTTITLHAAVPDNHSFVEWRCDNEDVTFSNPYSQTVTFIMPSSDVTVTAITRETTSTSPYISISLEKKTLTLDGKPTKTKIPVIKNAGGVILLPLTAMLDVLGVKDYYQYDDLILIENGDEAIELLINACEISHGKKREILSYPFCRIDTTEYIAADDFARLFGLVASTDGSTLFLHKPTLSLTVEGGAALYTDVPQGIWVPITAKAEENRQFLGWVSKSGVVFRDATSPDTEVCLTENATITALFDTITADETVVLPEGFSLVYTDQLPSGLDDEVSFEHTLKLETVNRSSDGYDAMYGWLADKAANLTIAKETVRITQSTLYSLGNLNLKNEEADMKNSLLVTVCTNTLDSCVSAFARAPIAAVCAYNESGETAYLYLPDLDTSCDTLTFRAPKIGVYYLIFDTYGIKPDLPYFSIINLMEEEGELRISGIATALGDRLDVVGVAYKKNGNADWTIAPQKEIASCFDASLKNLDPDQEYLVCMYAKDADGGEHFGRPHLVRTQSDALWFFSDVALLPLIGMVLLAAGIVLLVYLHKKHA